MIRCGIAGYGLAGREFHAPLIAATPGLHLDAIITSREAQVRADYPEVSVYSDLREVIQASAIDVLVIATPNETHFELAKQAIAAGLHVVMDKPMVLEALEAWELIRLARDKGVLLTPFHNRRVDSDFLQIKSQLYRVGTVALFESHFHRFRPQIKPGWREEQARLGTGVYWDLAPHMIDQALDLFGAPQWVFCDLETQRPDAKTHDYFLMMLKYAAGGASSQRGLRVILSAGSLVENPGPRFCIYGDAGSITSESQKEQKQVQNGDTAPSLLQRDYLPFYENLRDCVQDRSRDLLIRPEDGARVISIIQAGLRSFETGSWVKLPEDPAPI